MLKILTTTWHWEPSVLVGCAILLAEYLLLARRFQAKTWQVFSFVTGVICLLLALCSPLDELGDTYLFSAHMLQHLLLVLVVPPLWLLGLPAGLLKRLRKGALFARAEWVLSQPVLAWFVGVGVIWVWHLPPLFEATLENETVHIAEHLLFIASAVIFWWPVLVVQAEGKQRLTPLLAMFYLFAATVASSLLGIILTFTPPGTYPAYLHPRDLLGILPTLREDWNFTAVADQQLGGIFMWALGSPIYVLACFGAMARWYRDSARAQYETGMQMERTERMEREIEEARKAEVADLEAIPDAKNNAKNEPRTSPIRAATALPAEERV